jgi:hypothetical protein
MLGGPESHVTFLGVVAIVVFKFPNSVPAEFETPKETSILFFKKYFLSYLFMYYVFTMLSQHPKEQNSFIQPLSKYSFKNNVLQLLTRKIV